jgi:tRNA A37 threonylcarbamoyltransferase TsaD
MQVQQLTTSKDVSIGVVDNTVRILFTITNETIEKVQNFRNTHPGIDPDFFSKELNAAIKELLFRMSREFEGNV